MEPNFQTSFIPKQTIIEERVVPPRPIGLLLIVAVILLIAVVLVSAGLYFYKSIQQKSIDQMTEDLNLAKGRFEPARIVQLQKLDKLLRSSDEILSKHIAISPIFKVLEDITMKTVGYTRFNYSFDRNVDAKVMVKMSGLAVGYRSIALQSDLFTTNKNIIDPVFSKLVLDEKGNVAFELDFSIDPTFIDYKQMLKVAGEQVNTDI